MSDAIAGGSDRFAIARISVEMRFRGNFESYF
jgi:hypothetical protein